MNELSAIPQDSRPIVRVRSSRVAPWLFAGAAALGGLFLFISLESARVARSASTEADVAMAPPRALPDLDVPMAAVNPYVYAPRQTGPAQMPVRLTATRAAPRVRSSVPPRATVLPPPAYQPEYYPPPQTMQSGVPSAPDYQQPVPQADLTPALAGGSRAQRIAAPEFTVIQGTMIPAVLETAIDSTAAGPVRAIVSRDVRGFDGQRVLIPRGSRLVGDYQASIAPGQNRAVISWTRLIRPDGASMALKAPATDALGRVGVRGRVNNHTLRRITDTLLQTIVNAGGGFSQRAAPVIVLPQGGASASQMVVSDPTAIQPTLTVAQGARVSVFVSQDLDFSAVDGAQ